MNGDITAALGDWASGDKSALERLAPEVYPQLRDLAEGLMRRERAGHTLQATALVNELFIKLIAQREPHFENRRHFYHACAKLMRMALVDHARTVKRGKRDGGVRVPLHEDLAWLDAAGPQALDLDRLLDELETLDGEQAAMFESRFLLGCTADETADLFRVSKATVDRKVRMARAWLYDRMIRTSTPSA